MLPSTHFALLCTKIAYKKRMARPVDEVIVTENVLRVRLESQIDAVENGMLCFFTAYADIVNKKDNS